MGKLRIGVAGLGRGRMFVERFNELPECEVVAVCDESQKALADFDHIAAHTSYDDFVAEGLDVVAVITPGPVHAQQAVKAMESGAHVLCETPCIYSVGEARSIIATVGKTGKKYMLAEDYIWMGWAIKFEEMAKAGRFGQIVYAEGDYTHDCRDFMLMTENGYIPYAEREKYPDAKKSWRVTDLPPIFYTSHTLGPLLHFMEDRIVSAIGLSSGTHTAPDLGTIDLEVGLFETEKGAIIRLTNGFTVAHPCGFLYNLVGTEGSAKLQTAGEVAIGAVQSAGGAAMLWYSEKAKHKMDDWEKLSLEWGTRPDG